MALPAVGSRIRIRDDADGSGEMARGRHARVTGHTTGSYGLVPMVWVEIEGGPTPEMGGQTVLDLYDDEWELAGEEDPEMTPLQRRGYDRGRVLRWASDRPAATEAQLLEALPWARHVLAELRREGLLQRRDGRWKIVGVSFVGVSS